MATPSVSRPENCAALRAAPTRKAPANARWSVRGASFTSGGCGWPQLSTATDSKAPDGIRSFRARIKTLNAPLRLWSDIQGDTAKVRRAAAHHDVEPPRFHHALHVGAMVGQVFWPEVESDRPGLTRLQRHAPESAQLERRPRGPAHGVADVELHHLVSRPLTGVGHLDRNARPILGPDPSGRHAQVRVRERRVG